MGLTVPDGVDSISFMVSKIVREIDDKAGWRGAMQRMYGQRRRVATVAAAVLAAAVGYHVVFGQNGLTAYEKKKQDARMLAQELQDLNAENDDLKGHVERLQNDPGAIEHQAREALHYTRPGEVIVALPPDSVPSNPNP
jgi:cell division protein FtsB